MHSKDYWRSLFRTYCRVRMSDSRWEFGRASVVVRQFLAHCVVYRHMLEDEHKSKTPFEVLLPEARDIERELWPRVRFAA